MVCCRRQQSVIHQEPPSAPLAGTGSAAHRPGMQLTGKGGQPITCLASWFTLAGPKGKLAQWQDTRSAKELARAWVADGAGPSSVPPEIERLLASSTLTAGGDFAAGRGRPELRVPIDDLAGEPRNADLAFTYETPASADGTPGRRIAVSVEAKADESLGQTVGQAIAAAEARRRTGKGSFGDVRARVLLKALLGDAAVDDPTSRALRYQLLTATAGALAFAKAEAAAVAVLVIHEFVHPDPTRTSPRKLATNQRALDAFMRRLSGDAQVCVPSGQLIGPFHVPGNAFLPRSVPLVIGKVRRTLAAISLPDSHP